jgi:hypothetical protein
MSFRDKTDILIGWSHLNIQFGEGFPKTYSQDLDINRLGRTFRAIGYGYMWWLARAGDDPFSYAWGHGGSLIILMHELEAIVTTADPWHGQSGEKAWEEERVVMDLVGNVIQSIPGDG